MCKKGGRVLKGDEVLLSSGTWVLSENWANSSQAGDGVQSDGMEYRRLIPLKEKKMKKKIPMTTLVKRKSEYNTIVHETNKYSVIMTQKIFESGKYSPHSDWVVFDSEQNILTHWSLSNTDPSKITKKDVMLRLIVLKNV